jgi:phosphoribosyl 1,2-cyclic phosphodiesterase
VLIDAGLAGSELERRMDVVGLDPHQVDAVVLTHEHRDHASGVGVWARRFCVPVYAADGVAEKIDERLGRGVLKRVEIIPFAPGEIFEVSGLEFTPFSTSHDAHNTVGFRVSDGSSSLGFATDLGEVGDEVVRMLADADMLYLESNHDVQLVKEGPYPWPLKQRILSELGHLSNDDCAGLVGKLMHGGLKALVLGHLSETNNEPRLAFQATMDVLKSAGADKDVTLLVARQGLPGTVLDVA